MDAKCILGQMLDIGTMQIVQTSVQYRTITISHEDRRFADIDVDLNDENIKDNRAIQPIVKLLNWSQNLGISNNLKDYTSNTVKQLCEDVAKELERKISEFETTKTRLACFQFNIDMVSEEYSAFEEQKDIEEQEILNNNEKIKRLQDNINQANSFITQIKEIGDSYIEGASDKGAKDWVMYASFEVFS